MNIFYLDQDIIKCAEYHCDVHVVKMILEYTQILSSVCRINKLDFGYKLTHKNHPCVVWCNTSLSNFKYLKELIFYLNEEFKLRFNNKNHKSYLVSITLPEPQIKDLGFILPPKVMPIEFQLDSLIDSYRNYYRFGKKNILTYKVRKTPFWLTSEVY